MPCTSPIISPNRRSLDSEGLSLFHHSRWGWCWSLIHLKLNIRFGSAAQRLSREVNIHQSTRSLNTTQDNITSGKIAVSFDQNMTTWSDPSPYWGIKTVSTTRGGLDPNPETIWKPSFASTNLLKSQISRYSSFSYCDFVHIYNKYIHMNYNICTSVPSRAFFLGIRLAVYPCVSCSCPA